MELLQCDGCKKTSENGGTYGWRRIESINEFTTMNAKPIEHVCGQCWEKMWKAVR